MFKKLLQRLISGMCVALCAIFLLIPPLPVSAVIAEPWYFNEVGNATWTVPAGVTKVRVRVLGGGGGGSSGFLHSTAYVDNFATLGAGGGTGGMTFADVDVVPGETYHIRVGAGGEGAPNFAGVSQNGGDSWFSSEAGGEVDGALAFVKALGGGGGLNTNLNPVTFRDERFQADKQARPLSLIGGSKTMLVRRNGYFPIGQAKYYGFDYSTGAPIGEDTDKESPSYVSFGSRVSNASTVGTPYPGSVHSNYVSGYGGGYLASSPYNPSGPWSGAIFYMQGGTGGGLSGNGSDTAYYWRYGSGISAFGDCTSPYDDRNRCQHNQGLTYFNGTYNPDIYIPVGGGGSVKDARAGSGFRGLVVIRDITPVTRFIDIGLRIQQGTPAAPDIQHIAIEAPGRISPLRISKNQTIYHIALVDPADPNATKLRIKLGDGSIKALRACRADNGCAVTP